MTLRYHDVAAPDDLALDECVIRRASDDAGPHLRLWFYVRAVDGNLRWFSVPVNPGGSYSEAPRRTWGLARTAPGTWQVAPSINVLDTGPHPVAGSLWHETPALVAVPEPPPWEPSR